MPNQSLADEPPSEVVSTTDHRRCEPEKPVDNTATVRFTDDQEASQAEEGFSAWLTILGSFLVYFSTFGVVNSFGFFQTYYELDYLTDYSAIAITFIGTLQITLMYRMGSSVGALFDAYGLKWLYPVAAIGGTGSMLATSFAQKNKIYQLFLAQSLLFGLTVAFGVQPSLSVACQHFKKRRGLAMGLVASGSSVGGILLPIMFSKLIPKIGFGWSLRVGALVLLVSYLLAMSLSRSRLPPRKLRSFKSLFDYSGYGNPRYACLSVGTFVGSLGVYVPFYYVQTYCTILDPTASIKNYLLPLINVSSLFGRIFGGYLADKIGPLNIIYPMLLLSGTLCLAMWLPATHPKVVIAFSCLYGSCSGVFISIMPAATSRITPTERIGARLGAFGIVTSIAFLIGTPVAGTLIQSQTRAGYEPLIIFAGCALLGGGLIIFIARLLHDGNLLHKW